MPPNDFLLGRQAAPVQTPADSYLDRGFRRTQHPSTLGSLASQKIETWQLVKKR
jgi:hypothetical protein